MTQLGDFVNKAVWVDRVSPQLGKFEGEYGLLASDQQTKCSIRKVFGKGQIVRSFTR